MPWHNHVGVRAHARSEMSNQAPQFGPNKSLCMRDSEELGHGSTEIDKIDRLRDVVAESGRDALILHI